MADFQTDAQHPATPVRLQQAQRQGDVPKSQELASSIQLACGLGVIYLSIKSIANRFTELTSQFWATTPANQFTDSGLNDGIAESVSIVGRSDTFIHLGIQHFGPRHSKPIDQFQQPAVTQPGLT